MVAVLVHAKSSYLEPFQKLANDIETQTHEARDNFRMLTPLGDPCTRLSQCKLDEMPGILEEIVYLIRAIWANSSHLNSSDSMTELLRKVSTSLMVRCRDMIDRKEMMQGDIAASEHVLRQSISCGDTWKRLVETHQKLISHQATLQGSPQPEVEWDNSRIFAQMEAFMQRCADLLEVYEWRTQFSYTLSCDNLTDGRAGVPDNNAAADEFDEEIDGEEGNKKKTKEIPQLPPAFGGSRAPDIHSQLVSIRARFAEHMQLLDRLSYDPLDVKAPGWHHDFSKLKMHVKDLEVVLNNVIASSFETSAHSLDAFDLQEAFQHLATRDTVKRVVDKKSQDLCSVWAEDINWVKKSLDKNRKNPPRHMDEAASQYPYKQVRQPRPHAFILCACAMMYTSVRVAASNLHG